MMAPAQVTLEELERRLWKAANALRGPVDPADFKTYVFPMLFYKWLCDTHDWERDQAVADFGDDLDEEVEADYHRFDLLDDAHWAKVTTATTNIGTRIRRALGRIEQANPDTLAGIFGDASWGNKDRLPEPSLVNLIEAFNGLILNPEVVPNDLLGQAYEYLLKNFADESGSKAGEFFTPREVVHLLVRILDPQPAESVYDPACGSGGMLVDTINTVAADGGDTRTLRLYGQEVNLTTSAIARMNLFLHDIEDFRLVRGDTLRNPLFRDTDGKVARHDVVIANPPFSLDNWPSDVWAQDPRAIGGVPPAKNADFAWIQHMIASMKPDSGRVGVVMPHGVLFRRGAEAKIRSHLIKHDLLEAVIGLPPNLFYSTGIPACLLIFRAVKADDRKDGVLFIDGSACFTKGKNQNHLTDKDVATILNSYRRNGSDKDEGWDEGDDDDDGDGNEEDTRPAAAARFVTEKEIAANNYDLSIGRYLIPAIKDTLDVGTALEQLSTAREDLLNAEAALDERLKEAGYA